MEQNSNIDILGTNIEIFGNSHDKKVMSCPIRNDIIKFNMLFYCCFAHPTIMFRVDSIGNEIVYSGKSKIEDYELWMRLI